MQMYGVLYAYTPEVSICPIFDVATSISSHYHLLGLPCTASWNGRCSCEQLQPDHWNPGPRHKDRHNQRIRCSRFEFNSQWVRVESSYHFPSNLLSRPIFVAASLFIVATFLMMFLPIEVRHLLDMQLGLS